MESNPAAGLEPFDWRVHRDLLRRDAAFHGFVLAYWAIGLATAVLAGVPHKFVPFMYAKLGFLMACVPLVIGAGLHALRSREPFATLRRAAARPQTHASLLLFASFSVHLGVFTSIKTMLPDIVPFHADQVLANLDELVHGMAPWQYTTAIVPAELLRALGPLYFGAWGLLLPACLLACLLAPGLRQVRDQYLWTHLLVWTLLGNLIAAAGMSAGPVFYGLVTGDAARFSGLAKYLSQYKPLVDGMALLWKSHASGQPMFGGGISAFPSLHLANATLFVLLARHINSRLMWAAIGFGACILLCSIHLGLHYAVDGYFSIAATLITWWCVGWALRRTGARSTETSNSAVAVPA